MSSFPTSWRPGRPSTARVASLPWPSFASPRGPRLPRFNPGRSFPGLLLAGLILSVYFSAEEALEPDWVYTGPLPNLSGWTHRCGPFEAPDPSTGYGHNGMHWRVSVGETIDPCFVPIGGQSVSGANVDPPILGTHGLLIFMYGPNSIIANRWYFYDQWHRAVPALAQPIVPRAIAPAEVVLTAGMTAPPLTPAIVRPLPLVLAPAISWAPIKPEGNERGFFPYTTAHPIDSRGPSPVVRFVGTGADSIPHPANPEQKVPSNSRAGIALTHAFGLLSLYGTSQAFISALWRALPSNLRTRNARNADKLRDLAAHWGDIEMGEAFANSLLAAVRVKVAGALYGKATDALTSAFGEGAGFGLYRAWSTGEFAYSTSHHSFNPHRITRGGGSDGDSYFSPQPGPWGIKRRISQRREMRARVREFLASLPNKRLRPRGRVRRVGSGGGHRRVAIRSRPWHRNRR